MATTLQQPFGRGTIDLAGYQPTALLRLWCRVSGALCWRAATVPYLWFCRSRDRDELAELGERALKDIGLTKEMVKVEYAKPFWQE